MKIAFFCLLLVALAIIAVPSRAVPAGGRGKGKSSGNEHPLPNPAQGHAAAKSWKLGKGQISSGTPFKGAQPEHLPSPSHQAQKKGDSPPKRELDHHKESALRVHFSHTLPHHGGGR